MRFSRKEECHIKIRIIGACGSGKSYIARELSKKYVIEHYELDNLVWDRSKPNERYPQELRDSKLNEIVHRESWIIEGVHHKWGQDSFREADVICIICPNKYQRDFRVVKRFIRTRLGMEPSNYKQTLKNLFQMLFVWNRAFDQENLKDIMKLTEQYAEKRVLLRNNDQIVEHIENLVQLERGVV